MNNLWRFLHILSAVIAFGPGFAFPLIAATARKTPGSFPLVAKLGEVLGKRLIVPAAIVVLLTGLAQVYQQRIDLMRTHYLLGSLVLYLIALSISLGVQLPTGIKLARLAEQPPQPGQQGPPPEAMALAKRQKITGMILISLFLIILALMVFFNPGDVSTP